MTSDGQQLSSDANAVRSPQESQMTHWLALDANPRQSRLVIVADSRILDSFEAATGPRQVQRTLDFIWKTVPVGTNLKLVGRRYDRWPAQLETALVQEFGPVTWINPNVLTVTLPDVHRWSRMFNTYRALFFAVCAEMGLKRELHFLDKFELLDAWQNAVLYHLLADAEPSTVIDDHPTNCL